MPRVLVPLARGFEEIEAVAIVDVLRRAGVEVVLAACDAAGAVEGAHGIAVHADRALAEVRDEAFDLVILPGGEPGVTNLGDDSNLMTILERRVATAQPIAAICAAPRLLARAGWLDGKAATSHPSVAVRLREAGVVYDDVRRVVRDGTFLTSRGPGTAIEFALAALDLLGLAQQAAKLRQAMLVAAA